MNGFISRESERALTSCHNHFFGPTLSSLQWGVNFTMGLGRRAKLYSKQYIVKISVQELIL